MLTRSAVTRTLRWAALGLTLAVAAVTAQAWTDLGAAPTGARAARMEASPQWSDGGFVNAEPMWNDLWGMFGTARRASPVASPTAPVNVLNSDGASLQIPPESGLRVTWMGHSTVLVEIDGVTVLTDPIFAPRASPLDWIGPERWYPPVIPLEDLPRIDAVLISHDHYDHLQTETIQRMAGMDCRFVVPLGVGADLERWGVPPERITELDWWEQVEVGALQVHATPSRHASGRHLFDQNRTLWASYALVGPAHRVYFSGDTGLFSALDQIGERLGPFDLSMIEVGQYDRTWPDWHLGPEQAVLAHQAVQARVMLPIHWALWRLAGHGWTEPGERVRAAAAAAGVPVVMPQPGQSVEPAAPPEPRQWWPDLPWHTAEQDPIVATGLTGWRGY